MKQSLTEELHLRDYIWVLYKRKWTIALFFVLAVATVAIATFTASPIYRATATIMIERDKSNILDLRSMFYIDYSSHEFLNTQYRLIQSWNIASNAADKLGGSGGEKPGSTGVLDRIMFWKPKGSGAGAAGGGRISAGQILGNLSVEPIVDTMLARVQYESSDPALAADAANAVVAAYMESLQENMIKSVRGSTEYLSKKIEEQKGTLEESELLLQEYREQYNLISLTERESITVKKLAELNSDVLKAENARIEAELRYMQAKQIQDKPEELQSISSVSKNPFINRLKADELNLSNDLTDLSKKFGEKHPRIIIVKEKLKLTQQRLVEEIKKVVSSLKNEYSVSAAKENSLKKAFERLKAESQLINKHGIAYGVLLRDMETNRQLYEVLLTKLKEMGVTGGIQPTNVTIISEARRPTTPVKPRKLRNILLSVLFGLFGGAGLAFFIEYLDNTIKTPEDLDRYINIPYMGLVPNYSRELNELHGKGLNPLIVLTHPKSTAAEAYRGIRTAIFFSSPDKGTNTILITSAGPSEGKSLTASNIAITIAQSGLRTLLVDADFRRPKLHKLFRTKNPKGFSNLIIEDAMLEEVINKTKVPNLDVMVCGQIPPNPADLLGSVNTRKHIEELKHQYDRIVFDSPPTMPVTDSIVLGTLVDEVLLVVMAGKTPRNILLRAAMNLRDVNANVIGAVINNVKEGQHGYYYYQFYYDYYGGKSSESNNPSPGNHRTGRKT